MACVAPFRCAPARRAPGGAARGGRTTRAAASQFAGPPAEFNLRQATRAAGAALTAQHPSLAGLVEEGVLLAVPRPPSTVYSERRLDGYSEPGLVVLLGTSHLSRRSADDVALTVATLRPQAVAVELCRSRTGALFAEEGAATSALSLTGDRGFLPALSRALRLGGGAALLLRAALAAASSRVAGPAAQQLGAEFAAARKAADAVSATILLADRPVEVTLSRALAACSWSERARGVGALAQLLLSRRDAPSVTAEQMDALLASDSSVDALLSGFATQFPSLTPVLVHERDSYLAWSLCRSKAVCGAGVVVAVLGKGHLRGVTWALQPQNRDQLRFDDLSGRADARAAALARRPLWQRMAQDTLLAGFAVALWSACVNS